MSIFADKSIPGLGQVFPSDHFGLVAEFDVNK